MSIEISKETVGKITAEEYLSLSESERAHAASIMNEMQKRLLKVRLTTYESRNIQKAYREKRKSSAYWEAYKSEDCIGAFKIDENYVFSGDTPFEISRRIRELGCKKTLQAYSKGDNSMETLRALSRYDRDATKVSNMGTVSEVMKYLRSVGYKED